jgi:hypothetical protein
VPVIFLEAVETVASFFLISRKLNSLQKNRRFLTKLAKFLFRENQARVSVKFSRKLQDCASFRRPRTTFSRLEIFSTRIFLFYFTNFQYLLHVGDLVAFFVKAKSKSKHHAILMKCNIVN